MANLGSVTMSRGCFKYLSGSATRFVSIYFFAKHAHDLLLFVQQVLVLIDEDANLDLESVDFLFAMVDSSGE